LIPGITDTEPNLAGIAKFLRQCQVPTVQLLPYHPLWQMKNQKIGREDAIGSNEEMKQFMSAEKRAACRGIFEAEGIRVQP